MRYALNLGADHQISTGILMFDASGPLVVHRCTAMVEEPQQTTFPTSPSAQIIFAHMSVTHVITVAI